MAKFNAVTANRNNPGWDKGAQPQNNEPPDQEPDQNDEDDQPKRSKKPRKLNNGWGPQGDQAVGNGQPNQVADINALFNGLQKQGTPEGVRKPIVRRDFSGNVIDQNNPTSGMAYMDMFNKPQQVADRNRAVNPMYDEQQSPAYKQAAGAAGVQQRQMMNQQNQANRNANSVIGNDGYMTMFDGKGGAVGTNRPMEKADQFDGMGSTNPLNPQLRNQMQAGFNQDARQGRPMGPPAPSGMDANATSKTGFGSSSVNWLDGPKAGMVGKNAGMGQGGGGAPMAQPGQLDKAMQVSQQPKPNFLDQMGPNAGPQQPFQHPQYQFDQQIAAKQKAEQGGNLPYSNPFVGQPFAGQIPPDQQKVIDMFAPAHLYHQQSDAATPYAQRPIQVKPQSGATGALSPLTQWPMIPDSGVQGMAKYWPGYDWSMNRGPQGNVEQMQRNFDDLINKGLMGYQPSGEPRSPFADGPNAPAAKKMFKPKIVPQYPEEQIIQNTRRK